MSNVVTGFLSYHIYNTIRYIHFKSKKYDIMDMALPKRDVYLKKWNDEIINRKESLLFLKLDKLFDKDKLIRLFAYYYLDNKNFYVTDIFDNDLKLFRQNENELELLKDVLEKDFYTIFYYTQKNNKSIKNILYSKNGIPIIFKFYDRKKISVHTLIAFQLCFNIQQKIKPKNIVEEEKIKKYNEIFNKYIQIVYNSYNFDIKEHLKKCLNSIIKRD